MTAILEKLKKNDIFMRIVTNSAFCEDYDHSHGSQKYNIFVRTVIIDAVLYTVIIF